MTMSDDDALLEALRRRAILDASSSNESARHAKDYPPADLDELETAEKVLGFRLPAFLRRVYLEVADGGFGPAYGVYPVREARAGHEETLVAARNKLAADPEWPQLLLPICDWGCASWSCLDCRTDDGSVVTLAGVDGFRETGHDLRSWFRAWLAGADLWNEMFTPGPMMSVINPFTRKPMQRRGAGKATGRPWRP